MKIQELTCGGWAPKTYLQHLWVRYRMQDKDYNNLWAKQEGRCAGCQQALAHPLTKSLEMALRPEVDHEHNEGNKDNLHGACELRDVRGLLCRRCNDFLGKIQDNLEVLQNLLTYLQTHKGKK